jgi:hypothetical protein
MRSRQRAWRRAIGADRGSGDVFDRAIVEPAAA